VLEAMASGLPVVALDLGGPGVMVNESCGWKVPTAGKSADDIVTDLADGLIRLAKDITLRETLGKSAYRKVQNTFTWRNVVRKVFQDGHYL